jgi:uncharacterized protein involved in exopolysaccharide biosynthesis
MFSFSNAARAEPEAPAGEAKTTSAFAFDPLELLGRVRRRPWLVAGCGVAAVMLAVLALAFVPPSFTAGTQILIDPSDLRVVENGVTPNSQYADSGVSIVESQVRVIGSDSVLRRVVRRLDLVNDRDFVRPLPSENSPVEILKRILGFTPASELPRDPELRAIEALRRNMYIRRPERTFVIEVYVKSEHGEKAARIANMIAEVYMAEEAAARANSAGRASDALASRLAELRGALQAAEDKLAKYREDNKLVATGGRLLVDQRLGELNQQLTSASIRTEEARARADQARRLRIEGSGTALPEFLASAEMRALRQQLADLQRTHAETGARLGPRHPVVTEQLAQIRETERAIAREKARIIDSTVKELDRAVAAENAIRRELDKLKSETTVNDRALIGLREIEREVETQRTIYESFLRRARETGQQERLDTTNMRVISPATPPLGRTFPPSPKVLLPLAFLLGALAGAALAILLPYRRRRSGPLMLAVAKGRRQG